MAVEGNDEKELPLMIEEAGPFLLLKEGTIGCSAIG